MHYVSNTIGCSDKHDINFMPDGSDIITQRLEALETTVHRGHLLVLESLHGVQAELRSVRKELAHMRVDLDALDSQKTQQMSRSRLDLHDDDGRGRINPQFGAKSSNNSHGERVARTPDPDTDRAVN